MKTLTTLLLAFISLLTFAQTEGALTVSLTTSSAGGNYSPRNIVAIWVEDDNGNFVKTLMAYANVRKTHLNTWEASTSAAGSIYNVVDAITGVTRTSHGERTCFWEGTDVDGNLVDDGTYYVWMELTDKNGTGNFSSFSFTKGGNIISLSPDNEPSFSSISILWEPLINSTNEELANLFKIYPNPAKNIISIQGENFNEVLVYNSIGQLIISSVSSTIDISKLKSGKYLVMIDTPRGKITKKLIVE
jgi:hypothetical protein